MSPDLEAIRSRNRKRRANYGESQQTGHDYGAQAGQPHYYRTGQQQALTIRSDSAPDTRPKCPDCHHATADHHDILGCCPNWKMTVCFCSGGKE